MSFDIGIDLGTANVLVYVKNKGIVLNEPSVVAIDKHTGKVLEIGEEARKMIGRTPENIVAIRPLKQGVISNYDMTEKMLKYFINKTIGKSLFLKPRVAICVPSSVTGVERRAVEAATKQVGARQVFIIEEPIAAAIGAGIDISKACGSMVVDIGGGTTDVAVISLGGVVISSSLKIAGDDFDEAIVRSVRKSHNILIGERTAELLKVNIGIAYPQAQELHMNIRGRNLVTGLPMTVAVSSSEMLEALSETVASIVHEIHSVLEKTPPELISDISSRGIVMTGGGSLLYGLDTMIEEKTGIGAIVVDNPASCVVLGTGKYIEYVTSGR